MSAPAFDAVAIGNAIVDIIGQCDDAFLERHGSAKGSMRLVEVSEAAALYDNMGPALEVSGGSAANTMVGLASFGGAAGFIGKIADDSFGAVFAHDIRAAGVAFTTPASTGTEPTALSLVLVTPDGERTMHTHLGVSPDLGDAELDGALLESTRVVYLEGYLFDRDKAKAAFHNAAAMARKAGGKVALSLSDSFCVDRHREAFQQLVANGVDILFANQDEITALYQTQSVDDALTQLQQGGPSFT
ncbi:MAG: adenosine kinase, partial [Pseudomonadota bacterium]